MREKVIELFKRVYERLRFERLKLEPARAYDKIQETDAKLTAWIDSWNPYDPKKLEGKGLRPVDIDESETRKKATKYFLIFFGFFLAWAFLAPINAGVHATGNVSVLGNRKQVQHPTGGVVEEILVKEGDEVQKGDILLRVNPLKNEAELTGVELQFINLLATESRLRAERDSANTIKWSDELTKYFPDDSRVEEAKSLQQKLMDSRRTEFNSQVSALNSQIASQSAVLESLHLQHKTLDEEMRNTRSLAKEGYVPQAQANLAERQKFDIDQKVATTQQAIAQARLQISQLKGAMLKDIDTQLQEAQKNRDALMARMDATRFERNLSEVRAPVSGSVVGLKVFTVGGVITAAMPLMDIVPKNEILVVEAKIPLNVIDNIQLGMEADLHFTSFDQATTPVVEGVIKVIGADKELGQNAQEGEFYRAQIETTKEGLAKLGQLKIQAGMPVDVVVKAGERTFMGYLLKPLSDKLAKAFLDN